MADTTNPLPNSREPFVDRYRFINPVWLRWLKPLLETVKSSTTKIDTVESTVNGVTTTVTALQTSVDGIAGSWGVDVNVNGKVIGAVKLDGSATESSFAVLADRFVVSHPTSTSINVEVFGVGMVNGIETVGIKGELIVDGSITAHKITATTLDSVSVNAGTIRAGRFESYSGNFVMDLDNETIDIVAPPP